MSISAAEHVEMIQSIYVMDEHVHEDLKRLSLGKREEFASRILNLLSTSEIAKSKGLTDVASLKKALSVTKKDKDVQAAQNMLCNILEYKAPPAMLGVFWCL